MATQRLIVTVHGIRTFGQWQERLRHLILERDPDVHVRNYSYGYFSVVAFMVPIFRWLAVRHFRIRLNELFKEFPNAEVSIFAHSFGTHLVAWGLRKSDPTLLPNISNIVLAGSVLKSTFSWSPLFTTNKVHRVVNDCAVDDNVLLLSQFLVLFTGMAGRIGFYGFSGTPLINRYFRGGHSGYFGTSSLDNAFMIQYWLPLLDGIVQAHDTRESRGILQGVKYTLLGLADPLKLVLYGALAGTAIFAGYINPRRLAEDQEHLAGAHSINSHIRALAADDSTSIRQQALLAIHSWRLHPNPESLQFLATAVSAVNLHHARFVATGDDLFVSQNGAWLVSFARHTRQLVVSRINDSGLEAIWSTTLPDLGDEIFSVSLAVSDDGRHAASLVDHATEDGRSQILQIFAAGGKQQTPAPSAHEIFRLGGPDAARYLSFDVLRFSRSGSYLWGDHYKSYSSGMSDTFTYPLPFVCRLEDSSAQMLSVPQDLRTLRIGSLNVDVGADKYIALAIASAADTSTGTGTTTLSFYSSLDFHLIKSRSAPDGHQTSITFSKDADDLILTGGASFYTVIENWQSNAPQIVNANPTDSSIHGMHHAAVTFIPDRNALLVSGPVDLFDGNEHTPLAFVLEDWRSGSPSVVGKISNMGTVINQYRNTGDIKSVGIRGTQGLIVTVDLGKRITIWDLSLLLGRPRLHLNARALALQIPDDGSNILLGDADYSQPHSYPDRVLTVSGWREETPTIRTLLSYSDGDRSFSWLAVSPNGRFAARATAHENSRANGAYAIQLFSLPDGALIQELPLPKADSLAASSGQYRISSLLFSSDSQLIVVSTTDGTLTAWKLTDAGSFALTKIASFNEAADDFGLSVAVSPNQRDIAISAGTHIAVWLDWLSANPKLGSTLTVADEPDDPGIVTALAMSNNGTYLAAGTTHGAVRVWRDWQSRQPESVRSFETDIDPYFKKPARVMLIAFDPGSSAIAVLDRVALRVMRVGEATPTLLLPSHSDPSKGSVQTVRFTPDGRYVVVNGDEQPETLMYSLWRADDLVDLACRSLLLADLTDAERSRFLPASDHESTCLGLEPEPNIPDPFAG